MDDAREEEAVGALLAEQSSGPQFWPPEELPQTPPSPSQHAPRPAAPSNSHSPKHTTRNPNHRTQHAQQHSPTNRANTGGQPTSSLSSRRRSPAHPHAHHAHPPALNVSSVEPQLGLGLGPSSAAQHSNEHATAPASSAAAAPNQGLASRDSSNSSSSPSPVPILGVFKAPTSPHPRRQHSQNRHHHHHLHQQEQLQLQQPVMGTATPQGTGHAILGQLSSSTQQPHSFGTFPVANQSAHSPQPQAALQQQQQQQQQCASDQQHAVHCTQLHRDADVPLHPWLTPPQLFTRWRPPPLENPSNADLSPSVTRISPPSSPPAGLSTARQSSSGSPQGLSRHHPHGASRLASAGKRTLLTGKPVPVSMRKLVAQQAHMQDPINMLLDRFQITHALESHHHELQAWHAKHLDKQRQQQQRHSARGSCSGTSSTVNGKAGHRYQEKDSKACDPYSGTPIGAYLFKPEYSFAGSQPLKSDPGTCVLFERHPSTDPGLPPLQRCYLRAERNIKVQQQQQQRRQRELQERKQQQQEKEQRQLAALQQQQQLMQQQGMGVGHGQQVVIGATAEQGLPERLQEDGELGPWRSSPQRQREGQSEEHDLHGEHSARARQSGRKERPTSCSLKALPNGVPVSRLEYMHSLENRVAFTMANRAAAKQQLLAEQQGATHASPPSPPRAQLSPSHINTASPPQRRPEWPPFAPGTAAAAPQAHHGAPTAAAVGVPAVGAPAVGTAPVSGGVSQLGGAPSLRHSISSAPAHTHAHAHAHAQPRHIYAQQLSSSSGGTSGALRASHSAASSGDRSRRGLPVQASTKERKGQSQSYGPELLHDTAAARAAFGVARALRPGTAEPLLDEDFYRTVHSHFLNLTGAQTAELQGDLNASLPQIIESFGIVQR